MRRLATSSQSKDEESQGSKIVIVGSSNEAKTYFKTSDWRPSYEYPYNPDSLCPGNNYDTYDEMRRDDQIKAVLSLKKDFVIGGGWQIECGDEEIKEFVTMALKSTGETDSLDSTFEDSLKDILSAYDYGFSICEPIYKLSDGKYIIKSIKVRAPHSFKFNVDDKGEIESIEQNTPSGPLLIKPSTIIHHVHMPEFGNPYGTSDLKSAYSPWKAKKFVERFLAIYLERFASPTIVGRGRPGMTPGEMTTFLNVLKSIQQSTEIAVPDGVQVDFVQNARDASDAYMKALDYYNQRISRSMLVPDLIGIGGSTVSGGSFALGKKHFDIFLGVIKSDKDSLERKINSKIVKTLTALNFGPDVKCTFKFLPNTNDDILTFAKTWAEAVRGGAFNANDEEVNHFRKVLGFPEGAVKKSAPPVQVGPSAFPKKEENAEGVDKSKEGDKEPPAKEPKDKDAETFALREPTSYEKKVDYKKAEAMMDRAEGKLKRSVGSAAKTIWTDIVDQIRAMGIMKEWRPDSIQNLQARNLRQMEMVFRGAFTDLFVEAKNQAKKELMPNSKAFSEATMLPDEFLEVVKAESFSTVGDYSALVTKKAKTILTDGLKSGVSNSEVFRRLREVLSDETDKWLETVIRTKTTDVYNNARRTYWENDEVAKEIVVAYQFSAILDDRTSDVCRGLDGKIFDVNSDEIGRVTPALHFNCRSILVPVTRFEDHKLDSIPSVESINKSGGNLKTFEVSEDLTASVSLKNTGTHVIAPAPGEGKHIEIVHITASNMSHTDPVNVALKEFPDGQEKFKEYLDKMGGKMERDFRSSPYALTPNVALSFVLYADVPVEITMIYRIAS